jgi:NADH:ubiquinone oxidoreductase subunit 6 (subunit J)
MNAATMLFWPVVAVALAGAAGAVFARNLVYAALSLGACLTGLAGLYLFLQAEYVAVIQMIVYVGGILILILFGVMFSRDVLGRSTPPSLGAKILGGLAAFAVLVSAGRLAWIISRLPGTGLAATRSPTQTWEGQIASNSQNHLGELLLNGWLAPFLVVAMLLTVVLVAALGLVRKDAT